MNVVFGKGILVSAAFFFSLTVASCGGGVMTNLILAT